MNARSKFWRNSRTNSWKCNFQNNFCMTYWTNFLRNSSKELSKQIYDRIERKVPWEKFSKQNRLQNFSWYIQKESWNNPYRNVWIYIWANCWENCLKNKKNNSNKFLWNCWKCSRKEILGWILRPICRKFKMKLQNQFWEENVK